MAARQAWSVVPVERSAGASPIGIPEFDSDRIIAKFLTVKGMRGHSYQAVELALGMIASNRHGVCELSTHTFALEDTDSALRTLVGQGVESAVHCTVDPWR